jgi:hypothetical protein
MPLDLECPANYFGKGKNYTLPDDAEVVREFERRFQEWEREHPEDPTGDLALAKWEAEHSEETPRARVPAALREPTGEKEPVVSDDEDWKELEMILPVRHIEKLKKYASYKRRRPRDIVMLWIETYCKL